MDADAPQKLFFDIRLTSKNQILAPVVRNAEQLLKQLSFSQIATKGDH